MINVCVIVKSYVREAGVMLCSLYDNTSQNVNTYILSEGLEDDSQRRLSQIAEKYKQNIYFVNVDIDGGTKEVNINSGYFDLSTLYRLKVADALPLNVEKVIVLGTDLIFHIDIDSLWNTDMGDHAIMGVLDPSIGKGVGLEKYINSFPEHFNQQTYLNTEILLINLQTVRKNWQLWEQSIELLKSNNRLIYTDQDAINSLFKDDIGLLNEKYNLMTIYLDAQMDKEGIYHFAGDHILWKNDFARRRFFDYLAQTPWCEDGFGLLKGWVLKSQVRMNYYRHIIKSTEGKRKCFWGIDGGYFEPIMEYFNVEEKDFFVDANSAKWGTYSHGKEIMDPAILKECNDVVVIVLIYNYANVAEQLKIMGFKEDKDFFEGRRILAPHEGGDYTDLRV